MRDPGATLPLLPFAINFIRGSVYTLADCNDLKGNICLLSRLAIGWGQ